jgi:hypothetical protein
VVVIRKFAGRNIVHASFTIANIVVI